jgi:hypothetical protein
VSDSMITIHIDDRIRLAMAVLAASDWPEREQAIETHAVHQHSKQTRQFVSSYRGHAAATGLNQLLNSGVHLEDLFSAVLCCSWPDFEPVEPIPDALGSSSWLSDLPDFYGSTAIADFWDDHAGSWEEARSDLMAILSGSQIVPYLSQFLGHQESLEIGVMPSIGYPMLAPTLAKTTSRIYLVLPPAKAWGESPPWPFGEDPAWVVAQTCWHLAAHFMAESLSRLEVTQQATLRHAAVTLCLEREFDVAEAMAYLVRSKKEHNLPRLPLVVEALREYLADPVERSLLDLDY